MSNFYYDDNYIYYPTHAYVNDAGIWEPLSSYVKTGESCDYKLLISKEVFIEAYNKFIRDDTSSNSGKKVIY